jgi:chorismate mutase
MEELDPATRLSSYRQTIDNIDAALVHILAERFRCTEDVGLLKARYGLPPADKDREERQHRRLREIASEAKLDQEFVDDLMAFIVGKVVQRHRRIADEFETIEPRPANVCPEVLQPIDNGTG